MVVVYQYNFPLFPTAMNNLVTSSLVNEIVETILNNIVDSTMLLMHGNNVQALFGHQPKL